MKIYINKEDIYSKMQNVLYKTAFIYCFKTWSLRVKAQKAGFCVLWSAYGFVLLTFRHRSFPFKF